MIQWDEGLVPEQRTAASHKGSHARLLAGPGTGKTKTLTRRILWLITTQNVSPSEVLAITFTRAAASELKRSLERDLEGISCELPRVCTLHSFALRQLLRNSHLIQLPQPLRIADDYEERQIIIEELSDLIKKDVKETKSLISKLSADWQQLTAESEEWEERFPDSKFLGAWRDHREIYGYTLRAELVYQLKRALEEQGQSLDLENSRYVLIDEYQDLNACDLSIVKSLATLGCEIYCAGDDDQSIYGFRFANPEGIKRFANDYIPSEDKKLQICHRCYKNILDYGLYVADQDIHRISKTLIPKDESKEGEVHILRFFQQDLEAKGIAELCYWLINSKNVPPDEILILMRSDKNNRFSNPIRNALSEKNIPVGVVSNPLEPLDKKYGRELLCLMRLVCNSKDHLAWRTILSLNKNIGERTFSRLYEIAKEDGLNFSESLQKVKESSSLISRTGNNVSERIKEIETLLIEIGIPDEENIINWIENLANRIIYDENEKKEVLDLLNRIKDLSGVESLEELLRALNISLGDAEQEKEIGKVALMTMHQAKGLSSDAIILAVAEDEHIPLKIAGTEIDDERRLLYVSLTRARKYLYVTFCQRRTGQQCYSGRKPCNPVRTFTRFLSGGPHLPKDGISFINSLKA
jgi:DNA helicase-2/ATP-dependent DNA helicase PcrA